MQEFEQLQQELNATKIDAYDAHTRNKNLNNAIGGLMKISGFEGNDLNQFGEHLKTLVDNQVKLETK